MGSTRDDGLALLGEMIPGLLAADSGQLKQGDGFASELGELSLDAVFGRLWVRPGLDRRSRSLVTLGILIALRAEDELRIHFGIALRNGLTREELAEVIYHATAYAGFPAAATASRIGGEVLDGGEPGPRDGAA